MHLQTSDIEATPPEGEMPVVLQASCPAEPTLEIRQHCAEYLAFIVHDLRAPLNAISLATSVLEAELARQEISDEVKRTFGLLRSSISCLETLIGEILEVNGEHAFETALKLERRHFSVSSLVRQLIDVLLPLTRRENVRLINEVPTDLIGYADAGLMRRVLQNLATNAIRFTPRGEVKIGARDLGDQGGIEYWVSDNGSGIPEAMLANIFEKTGMTAGRGGRGGLGLSIVRSFVEAHGGSVTVRSSQGRGTTFRFHLPDRTQTAGSSEDVIDIRGTRAPALGEEREFAGQTGEAEELSA